MLHFTPSLDRCRAPDELFFPEIELDAAPLAMVLLSQWASELIGGAALKVSKKANENTRRTLQEHIEGHRRDAILREKCRRSYDHTVWKAEIAK